MMPLLALCLGYFMTILDFISMLDASTIRISGRDPQKLQVLDLL